MAKPIATAKGVAIAFPDVCKTPIPLSPPIPLPYPNIAQLNQASGVTDLVGKELLVGPAGDYVLLKGSEVAMSSGNEAGSVGGVKSGKIKGKCTIIKASGSVIYGPDELGIARFLDQTEQNDGNVQGVVLSAFATVLVGD